MATTLNFRSNICLYLIDKLLTEWLHWEKSSPPSPPSFLFFIFLKWQSDTTNTYEQEYFYQVFNP